MEKQRGRKSQKIKTKCVEKNNRESLMTGDLSLLSNVHGSTGQICFQLCPSMRDVQAKSAKDAGCPVV